ncbi:unnamed protein product [Pleuronectes platessa]|uniref:Uncharacterized protein n=1 Tax=Pleuronectes platessa TaxID=8262 RepID=A0A9N7VHL2_PLEPL|nr:unnamed protein product [Pleuronectes platessa]
MMLSQPEMMMMMMMMKALAHHQTHRSTPQRLLVEGQSRYRGGWFYESLTAYPLDEAQYRWRPTVLHSSTLL